MVLRTKYILNQGSKRDGTRISVMRSHELNDGGKIRVTERHYHGRSEIVAPPLKLIHDLYLGLPWGEFTARYVQYLREEEVVVTEVRRLAQLGIDDDITLLCAGRGERSHRRILGEECKRQQPHLLKVIHL